jgi:hypothetical protein
MDPKAIELIEEIRRKLPNAEDWLNSPHSLLGGETPTQRLRAGDIERVRNLFESILYIGIT